MPFVFILDGFCSILSPMKKTNEPETKTLRGNMAQNKGAKKRKVIINKFGEKVTPLSLRVDLEVVEFLDREAWKVGKSTNKHIDIILRDYWKAKKKKG